MANVADNFKRLFSFQSATEIALKEAKAALTERDSQISALQAAVESLKAKAADSDDTEDTSDSDDSEVDQLISDIEEVFQKYKSDDKEDSDSDDESEDSTDSDDSEEAPDDSDDANDESAKATKSDRLKSLLTHVSKLTTELKAEKAASHQKVIKEIASVGIPTPIATKVDGTKPVLKGKDRVAAAFNEQFTK